jgi:hypothetical protein
MNRTIPLIAALLIAAPAMAQTAPPDPAANSATNANSNVQPGTGGKSKAGKPGLTGNKSGPSDKSGSSTDTPAGANEGASTGTAGSDDSGVPGEAGNKSGPATK